MGFDANTSWALVGPGAIGLYYGGLLGQSGAKLHVLARSDADAMSHDGITIRMIDPVTDQLNAEHRIKPEQVTRDAADIGPVDVLLIAAKSTANASMPECVHPLVEPGRTVILNLQNGMGNAEFFAGHFPHNPILVGICFVCVNRTAPAVVENYLPGRVEIGSLKDHWPTLAGAAVAAFSTAGIKTTHAPVLDAVIWRKLCWNIPFNGLAIAAGGITTDLILGDPELKVYAGLLMNEVRAAAALAGHRISDEFIQKQFEVTRKMGPYKPSSLIDYLDGRAVEVESIWGEPLRRGEALGQSMPELRKLYTEIAAAVAAQN